MRETVRGGARKPRGLGGKRPLRDFPPAARRCRACRTTHLRHLARGRGAGRRREATGRRSSAQRRRARSSVSCRALRNAPAPGSGQRLRTPRCQQPRAWTLRSRRRGGCAPAEKRRRSRAQGRTRARPRPRRRREGRPGAAAPPPGWCAWLGRRRRACAAGQARVSASAMRRHAATRKSKRTLRRAWRSRRPRAVRATHAPGRRARGCPSYEVRQKTHARVRSTKTLS